MPMTSPGWASKETSFTAQNVSDPSPSSPPGVRNRRNGALTAPASTTRKVGKVVGLMGNAIRLAQAVNDDGGSGHGADGFVGGSVWRGVKTEAGVAATWLATRAMSAKRASVLRK